VDWLQQRFKLDLSKVSRLGGHSQPRTHRGKERFPGFAITCVCRHLLLLLACRTPASERPRCSYALMEALEDVEKRTEGKLVRRKHASQCKASPR
jgi:hypothetical protein